MTILPKAIYRFNVIPMKLLMAFFPELEPKISQFVWKNERPQIAKAIFRKKTRARGIREKAGICFLPLSPPDKQLPRNHWLNAPLTVTH